MARCLLLGDKGYDADGQVVCVEHVGDEFDAGRLESNEEVGGAVELVMSSTQWQETALGYGKDELGLVPSPAALDSAASS